MHRASLTLTLALLSLLALGGCSSAPPEAAPQEAGAEEPDPHESEKPLTKPADSPGARPRWTAESLRGAIEASAERIEAAHESIEAADEPLEDWANASELGPQLQEAFEARGEELDWEPKNTTARVVKATELAGDALGTTSGQCESAEGWHYLIEQALEFADATQREDELGAALAALDPRALERALEGVATATRDLDAAAAPVIERSTESLTAGGAQLGPPLRTWQSSDSTPEARAEAVSKIRAGLSALDAKLGAALSEFESFAPAAQAHQKATLALAEAHVDIGRALARWVKSLGDEAPAELREAFAAVDLEGE